MEAASFKTKLSMICCWYRKFLPGRYHSQAFDPDNTSWSKEYKGRNGRSDTSKKRSSFTKATPQYGAEGGT